MKIISTGRYIPPSVLTNADLVNSLDITSEWILSNSGIKNRHISSGENTHTMAYNASLAALEKASLSPQKIDLIIVCTCTADAFIPSVACMVQKELGISNCMSFDINAACSGFIYGLTVVQSLMNTGKFKYALLIGADVLSKLIDWEDKNTCIHFGDGAGSAVIEYSPKSCLEYTYCDAKPDNETIISGGIPIKNPFFKSTHLDYKIKMEPNEVIKFADDIITYSINKILIETTTPISEIDYFVCCQLNSNTLGKIAKNLHVNENKFYMNFENYGNTSSAGIPIALDEMEDKGLIKEGSKILVICFGAGLTWGAALVNW